MSDNVTNLEVDEAELASMWPTEWRDYAANVMGIPASQIEYVSVHNDGNGNYMSVVEY